MGQDALEANNKLNYVVPKIKKIENINVIKKKANLFKGG